MQFLNQLPLHFSLGRQKFPCNGLWSPSPDTTQVRGNDLILQPSANFSAQRRQPGHWVAYLLGTPPPPFVSIFFRNAPKEYQSS